MTAATIVLGSYIIYETVDRRSYSEATVRIIIHLFLTLPLTLSLTRSHRPINHCYGQPATTD